MPTDDGTDAPALIRFERGDAVLVVDILNDFDHGDGAKGDPIILKHRYSAFDHTALDLLLGELEVQRVVLVGAATEGCVVQTAIDAREHGLRASIVVDACATNDAELESTALHYAAQVGGIRLEQQG